MINFYEELERLISWSKDGNWPVKVSKKVTTLIDDGGEKRCITDYSLQIGSSHEVHFFKELTPMETEAFQEPDRFVVYNCTVYADRNGSGHITANEGGERQHEDRILEIINHVKFSSS